MGATGERRGRPYHHGDLRAALIRTSFELLSETGLAGFSVARVARRLGVSTAAPYRHFPDRDHLLSAVAATAARELADEIRAAVAAAGPDPIDRFAASAAAYVLFAAGRSAGFNVIFAAGLNKVRDPERTEAGRALMDLLLSLAEDTGDRPRSDSLWLLEQQAALAHGYATLFTDGFFTRAPASVEDIAARAARGTRELFTGLAPAVDPAG